MHTQCLIVVLICHFSYKCNEYASSYLLLYIKPKRQINILTSSSRYCRFEVKMSQYHCTGVWKQYTHKTSSYWTSSYKMSSNKMSIYQTSSYKTSRLQNVLITKRPYYQTSRLPNVQLPNVQLQNVYTSNYYKTSSFFLFSNTDNYDGFSPLKKYVLYLTLT